MPADIGIEHAPIPIIGQFMASAKNSNRAEIHIGSRIGT
jgi:hypothetical protein